MTKHLLKIYKLCVHNDINVGDFHAEDGTSQTKELGELTAMLGETGAGKSDGIVSGLKLIPMSPVNHPPCHATNNKTAGITRGKNTKKGGGGYLMFC